MTTTYKIFYHIELIRLNLAKILILDDNYNKDVLKKEISESVKFITSRNIFKKFRFPYRGYMKLFYKEMEETKEDFRLDFDYYIDYFKSLGYEVKFNLLEDDTSTASDKYFDVYHKIAEEVSKLATSKTKKYYYEVII